MAREGCDDHSGVSDETRMLAAQVRVRAAGAPTEEHIRALGVQALTSPGRDMTAEQIRTLTDHAVDQARQVGQLLTRLADLLGEPRTDER